MRSTQVILWSPSGLCTHTHTHTLDDIPTVETDVSVPLYDVIAIFINVLAKVQFSSVASRQSADSLRRAMQHPTERAAKDYFRIASFILALWISCRGEHYKRVSSPPSPNGSCMVIVAKDMTMHYSILTKM